MWDWIFFFIMVPMVYLSFAMLVGGLVFKLVLVFRSPGIAGTRAVFPGDGPAALGILKDSFAMPAVYRKDRVFWFFLLAYHIAFFLLFLGHLELVWDVRILQLVPHGIFLGGGAVGGVLIVSVLYFLFRRFRSPHGGISVPEDYIILLILLFTFVFGSILHLADRYGSIGALTVPVQEYRAYLSSLVVFRPRVPAMIASSPHFVMLVLHVLFANIFLMLFPWSKMIHSVFIFFSFRIKRS